MPVEESSQDCGKHATQQRRINQRACSRRFRQSADSFSQNHRFLAVFTQWVCSLASTPPKVAASPPPNGGNGIIRGVTRRRHAGSQFLMLQNPHRQPASCATSPTRPGRRADWREKTRPTPPLQPRFREKTRPARQNTPNSGQCKRAGRTFSRTRRDNVATLKPTTPLLAPNRGALKPASPLRPKTAPKTPISHPQRRRRFQSRLGRRPQRRRRFQTTRPLGSRVPAAAPAGINVPAAPKTRMQFDGERFQQRLETLQSQRCEVMV